ncbi:MAG: zinc ABC transporter substrate-binding protein [Alphaproteobacteria bacterium]
MARNGILLAATAFFAWAASPAGGAAAPKVVASIGPVHSLVASVMAGLGEPALVVSGKGSPHAYALKPSDVRALHHADLVFWVGPDLETFLDNTFERMAGRVRSVALSEAAGVNLLPNRAGGLWAERPGDAAEGSRDADGHGRGRTDMHVWLDPLNGQAMVEAIVAALAETDSGNTALYRANGARTRERLAALDREIAGRLAPIAASPYLVWHDAYHYFERRYGLRPMGAVSADPERAPGARRVALLRRAVIEQGIRCLFIEPQFEPALARTIVAGTAARVGVLDPLGAGVEPGPDAYFAMMQALADSLAGCLQAPR